MNKRAGYDLFGNMDICGTEIQILQESFIITGVIEDRCEEESNIYLPVSSSGDEPTEVVVFLDEALSVMQVKNALKSVLSEDQYDFVAFGKLGSLVNEICVSGIKLVDVGILLILLVQCLSSPKERFLYLKQLAKSFYCRELFQNYAKEVFAVTLLSLSMVLVSSVIITLIASLVEFVWIWSDGAPLLNLKIISSSNGILSDLKTKVLLSSLFMLGLMINVVFYLVLSLRRRY